MKKARSSSAGRAAKRRASATSVLHQAVLDSMPLGACAVDAEQRITLYNHRFIEIYQLPPGTVRVGMPMREMIERFSALGHTPNLTAEEIWRRRLKNQRAGKPFDFLQQMVSGITVAIRYRPIADGGWVTYYEDVTDRQRMDDELRLQVQRFDQALANMSHGLCMFGADERLIVCNEKYVSLYDLDPQVVKPGITHREIIEHWISRGNQPGMSADTFYQQRMHEIRSNKVRVGRLVRRDGRVIEATSHPTPEGGWVSANEDITDRLRAEATLKEQNLLLDAALENMAHGLCVYDKDLRVVRRNQRYLDMYGLDAEAAKPGTAMLDLMRASVARGVHAPGVSAEDMHADFIRRLIDDKEPVLHRRLADGRCISVRHQPMANGGWVGTYEDVTARERALEELGAQYRRFDAALNNMSQGLCMLDANLRVIVCNRQYLQAFGLSEQIVKPGVTMREILEHSVARGNHRSVTAEELYDDYVEKLAAGTTTILRHLADGRVIQVDHHPMEHGGWVATYEDVTERLKAEERVAHMARHDALTDLPNRVVFREKMAEGLAQVETLGRPMAVLYLDLDNFKSVNDTLGHSVGDKLLKMAAQRLVQTVDAANTVARLGGDEFAILQSAPQPAAAEALAHRIIEVIAQPMHIDGQEISSGVSIGIAIAPDDGLAADHLMKCADLALYRAKAEGRGIHRLFQPDMDLRIRARRALEVDLRRALAGSEFNLVYQPQVRLATNQLTGFEALLRWTHAERGSVLPREFIPVAEETGLIVPLGEWVLRRACAEAATWPDPIRVAVNLSPIQFKNRGLVATVASALAMAGLAANRLELEITEAVLLLQDDEVTVATLHQLRALGVRISLDDFGVGYSSLSSLRSFPFDKIKIDRSFIADLERCTDNAAIIRALAGLGASLGFETTAEGVETAEQLDLIRRDGCTDAQGYFFSPPRPAAEVFELIARFQRDAAAA